MVRRGLDARTKTQPGALTMEAPQDLPAPALLQGRFSGREVFQQAVRDAFATAAREGWSDVILSDANFHDWPLGERAVIESLQAWARTGRR